jgi:MazG family protein
MTPIERLVDIMKTLRSEEGCPWDREQTLETLRPYAVEEVYEVLDAIDRGDVEDHCEELGDLLLQVVFHAQLRSEAGEFTFDDVAKSISDKMVRRHPHVFGDVEVEDSNEVLRNWEQIKAGEKAGKKVSVSALDGVPLHLPALLKAHELQKKAAKVGFDWPDAGEVLKKVREEIDELEEAVLSGDTEHAREELGDLLFVLANVGRHLDCTAEQALQDGNTKFRERFVRMEALIQEEGHTLGDLTLSELDNYWDRIKTSGR